MVTQSSAMKRLIQLGYHRLADAEAVLDRAREVDRPCRNGHFGCALITNGKCLGELWAIVAELREEAE